MKKELVKKVNAYLANIAVSYVKLHNLHWNITGPQFKTAHEYLETLYDGFGEELDAVAELLRMQGEAPLASMRDYLSMASIEELDSKELDVASALQILLGDMETLRAQAEDIRLEADQADAYRVANMMEDALEGYDKTIWFVKSMLK